MNTTPRYLVPIRYLLAVRAALGQIRCLPIITDSEMATVDAAFTNESAPVDVAYKLLARRRQL